MPPQYAEIVPLERFPRQLGFFDYKISDDLMGQIEIGQMVLIPLRKSNKRGVVTKLKDSTSLNYNVKPIIKILDADPILKSDDIKSLIKISEKYFVSPGILFKHAIPEIPLKKRSRAKGVVVPEIKDVPSFSVSASEAESIKNIIENITQNKNLVVQIDNSKMIYGSILILAKKILKDNGKLLILFPTHSQAEYFYSVLKKFGINAEITFPQDSKNKTFDLWQDFKSGRINILIGTQGAAFFPLSEKDYYIIFDETADEWKQNEINPRLDTRLVLRCLQENNKAGIVVFTPTVSIATPFFDFKKINHCPVGKIDFKIIDLSNHFKTGSKNILSDGIYERLENGKKVLFFMHRKGWSSNLRCKDCGFVAKCSNCDIALAQHKNFMRCVSCGNQTELLISCPKCGSINFMSLGSGDENLTEELKNSGLNLESRIVSTSFLNEMSIINEIPNFDLICIVDVDSILHRADFRTSEDLARIVTRLTEIARKNNAPLLIQTSFPEISIWKLAEGSSDDYYKEEMENRNLLHYPPSWHITKLIVQNSDAKESLVQAENIKKQLTDKIMSNSNIELVGPYESRPFKVRNIYRQILLIKKPRNYDFDMRAIVADIPEEVIIDIDTNEILR